MIIDLDANEIEVIFKCDYQAILQKLFTPNPFNVAIQKLNAIQFCFISSHSPIFGLIQFFSSVISVSIHTDQICPIYYI